MDSNSIVFEVQCSPSLESRVRREGNGDVSKRELTNNHDQAPIKELGSEYAVQFLKPLSDLEEGVGGYGVANTSRP